LWVAVLVLLVSGLTFLTNPATPAQALCVTPREQGRWTNVDSATRSITRVSIRFVCQDVWFNGQPYPPGAPFYIRLDGKCSPTDCDWGEHPMRRIGTWLYAYIDQGFAKRSVWVQTLPGDRLRVYIWTNFTDPGRADYASNDIMRRF